MIYFEDIPEEKLVVFKEAILSGEPPSSAMRKLYDSMGIIMPNQVALSTAVDVLEWGIPNLDIGAVSGHVIDSGCPFFENERDSSEFDKLINEWSGE